jgi:hypothetical protein
VALSSQLKEVPKVLRLIQIHGHIILDLLRLVLILILLICFLLFIFGVVPFSCGCSIRSICRLPLFDCCESFFQSLCE